jgi:predicted Zn-dependent peptidase
MRYARVLRTCGLVAIALALGLKPLGAQRATPLGQATGMEVPVEYHQLDNGLKVVLSPDRTTPTAVVAVYYNIGFRNEPRDRTGFAHLFEHMMFQGSQNLGKMEFIRLVQQNGGVLNGSTRFDYTNYFEIVPSNVLETVLWAEADRMRGLDIDQDNLTNQQGVVKNEVRVNVLNQPYGGFPWLDLPQAANTNWYNAHNFYGELEDLDAATLDDVASFFRTFYAPNNAVLVVTGDFDSEQTLGWIEEYFGDIPAVPQPAPVDLTEPRQTEERRAGRVDPLAERPALGVAWHVPERWTPEWFAFGLIDQIIGQGRDSRLYQELVQERGLTGNVAAGINWGLGNMYNYSGPMLYILSIFHDNDVSADAIVAGIDDVVAELTERPVDQEMLERARVKARSQYYSMIESTFGFGRADLLASLALFDDDPGRINRVEAGFAAVTPELIQRTAREYLRPTNRTLYMITPGEQTDATATSTSATSGR